MASEKTELNSYIRNIIAPIVFPSGHAEKNNQIYGECPDCHARGEHCSIVLVGSSFGGHCVKCEWTLKKFRADHPEYEKYFSNYTSWLSDNSGSSFGEFDREHFYLSESGKTLYRKQIYRKPGGGKYAVWATLQQDGKTFVNNLPRGKHAPIYHLDEITSIDKDSQEWIYLCEGEKDADMLRSLMHTPATCLPNGAITQKTKLHSDWLDPFAGQRVVVVGDNDAAGVESADALVLALFPVALVVKKLMPTDLLGLQFNEIAAKKKGYDVSDYIEEVGSEVAYQTIKRLSEELPAITPENQEQSFPDWVLIENRPGKSPLLSVNEPLFCNEFKKAKRLTRINGIYYCEGEMVSDDRILGMIQSQIQDIFVKKTGQLALMISKTLANTCYAEPAEPDERKIYCKGNVSLIVGKDGSFYPYEEDVPTLLRLPVRYNPSADCPLFKQYLSVLLYDEDIPAVQEFFGYCLIPCTRAQSSLFIKGKGGEGKSIITSVIMALFGHTAVAEKISNIEKTFTLANLVNKLVCIDDDIKTDKFDSTENIKKVITAREPLPVERKFVQSYQARIFARIIGLGNSFIGSKFDHSDGFYRRQLLIDCKPKTREASDDDSYVYDRCVAEVEGIFTWALQGLRRLIGNNYKFTISERMKKTLDDVKYSDDNVRAFLDDDSYVIVTSDWSDHETSALLFKSYALFCKDNGDTPVKRRTFQTRISDMLKDRKTRIDDGEKRCQGYSGIQIPQRIKYRLDRVSSETIDIDRLP